MKRSMIILVTLSLMFSMSYALSEISPWAKDDIDFIFEHKLLGQRMAERYQQEITRAEFAYIGVRLYENITGEKASVGKATFPDTSDPYVLKAKNLGIVDGYPNGSFAPNIYITRQEIAKLFIMTLKSSGIEVEVDDEAIFSDDDSIMTWAKEYVYKARAIDVIKGVGDNAFNPSSYTTREQAMVMFKRIMDTYGKDAKQISTPSNDQGISVGKKAPNFKLKLKGGETLTLSDYRGEPVVLIFITDYCSLCEPQLQDIESIKNDFEKVNFVAINIIDSETQSTNRISEAVTFLVLEDQGAVGDSYDIEAVPTSVVIDSKGNIVYYNQGSVSIDELVEQLNSL